LRTLLHTAPIHALEDNEGRWDGDWGRCDLRRLQVACVIASWRVHGVPPPPPAAIAKV